MQTLNLTGILAGGGESQPIDVVAVSSDTSIIATPVIDYVSPSTSGVLQYAPVGVDLGIVTITVTVTDGGLDRDLATTDDNASFQREFDVEVIQREFPWTNPRDLFDVNADEKVNLVDAFLLISELRIRGVGASLPPEGPGPNGPFVDNNSNNQIDLVDAFRIIEKMRELFGNDGEGEAADYATRLVMAHSPFEAYRERLYEYERDVDAAFESDEDLLSIMDFGDELLLNRIVDGFADSTTEGPRPK